MVHRLERLGIWLGASVGGVTLLYAAITAQPDTPSVVLGVLYVLGIALLAVGVLGFASEVVVAVHGRLPGTAANPVEKTPALQRPGPTPVEPAARGVPTPTPTPTTTKTAEEHHREFVPPSVTPLSLMSFFEGRTTAQGQQSVAAYIGKWLRFSGTVSNVQVFNSSAVVTCYVERSNPSVLEISISLWFLMSNKERVRLLSRGDPIVVSGRIERLASLDIELRDCELVSP
jgi:hypothetical protein